MKKEPESPTKSRASPEKVVKTEPKEEPMSDDDVPLVRISPCEIIV